MQNNFTLTDYPIPGIHSHLLIHLTALMLFSTGYAMYAEIILLETLMTTTSAPSTTTIIAVHLSGVF